MKDSKIGVKSSHPSEQTTPGSSEKKSQRAHKDPSSSNKVVLEQVLGLTVPSNASLACSPSSGLIAYPAGCTVVFYNSRKNRQTHITNTSRKTITSIGFSEDGRYLITGECGHLPNVRIWDVVDKTPVAEFSGHKFGINCVAFAPNNKYVVSVGSQHDMIVNVWDWKNNVKVASNKISTKVKAISFSENGNYFVTAGNRHVKFWYLEYSRSKYKDPMPLMGRSAILGEQRNNYFCDVGCGRGEMGDSTYAITKSGLLCEFNNRRLLDKWVELRTQNASCLSVGEDFVFIGCGDGIIRCFSPHTLQFITTLPRTHYLGVDVSKGLNINHMANHAPSARYPDAKAITYDEQNFKVTVVYNDHSIYVWDVRDIKKVGKSHSFIFHSACIWGLEIYPSVRDNNNQKPVLPPGSFITCSSDDTIRIWNLSSNMTNSTLYRRNIYSDELLKTLYIDSELNYIKELDTSKSDKSNNATSSNGDVVDQRNGVRCIRISPDGKHLASGDRSGNIRVHELQFMDELVKIEAHDAEVLCLEYCSPTGASHGKSLLVSASRDRLIHVFNAGRDYSFLTTLDDHSSSITAVRFLPAPHFQMVSCGADKSIIFRDISVNKKGSPEFSRGTHVVGKTTLYDMEVDHNSKHILTACQDRNIRVYSVSNGKHFKTFKGSPSEDGTLIKVVLDSSGIYAATSCTDKTLAIYDYISGECMATMFGHSELVTGLKFTEDSKHLISVSGDGCIFIWKLPQEMTNNMLTRLQSYKSSNSSNKGRVYIGSPEEDFGPPPSELLTPSSVLRDEEDEDSYRFSVGKLPVWAKKQIGESNSYSSSLDSPKGLSSFPKGRWGQRAADSGGLSVKSHYESDSNLHFSSPKMDSCDNSSSLEEQIRSSPMLSHRKSTNNNKNNVGFLNKRFSSEYNTEHDADIDEFSDGLTTQDDGGESTEPEHMERTMYFGGQSNETPSQYTVNEMNVDELRRSQRRKSKRFETPSQESEEDFDEEEDDENSTPSVERNLTSSLSAVSSENVDLLGRRERFMKSNFDSLSGSELQYGNLNTISNQYREGSAVVRNAGTIARAQSFRDEQQNKKREELQRKIETTRRKLQNIGYRSTMRESQSISDLSLHIPEKELSNLHHHHQNGKMSAYSTKNTSSEEEERSGLRRTCSLSDLNKPSVIRRILPVTPSNVSGKKVNSRVRQLHGPPVLRDESPSYSNAAREDFSVETLPSYMKSTSASLKKQNYNNSLPRRRVYTSSTSDLRNLESTPSRDEEDSSSEENIVRRIRSSSQDRRSSTHLTSPISSSSKLHYTTRSERDLSKVTKVRLRTVNDSETKPKSKMKTSTLIISSENENINFPQCPINLELANRTSQELKVASENLVRLMERILTDTQLEEAVRAEYLGKLTKSASFALQIMSSLSLNGKGEAYGEPERRSQTNFSESQSRKPYNIDEYPDNLMSRSYQSNGASFSNGNQGPSWC